MTEIEVPSSCEPPLFRYNNRPALPSPNHWHRPWDLQLQAEWYDAYTRLLYSMDEVEQAVWWGVCDSPNRWPDYLVGHPNETYKLPWLAHDGILDERYEPKPGYHKLLELSRRWELR